MDADLQHPRDLVTERLIRALHRYLDLVVASRYNAGGHLNRSAYYWPSVDPVRRPVYWEKLVEIGDAAYAGGGVWIAPVVLGFDSRVLVGSAVVAWHTGETLRRSTGGTRRSSPDAVGVISWDESSENTHVEPTEHHGPRYLEIIADILEAQPHSLAELDSSDVASARQATDFAYRPPLLALGVGFMATAIWRSRKRAAATRK